MMNSSSPINNIVLITGASSGIGAKTAEFLASKNFTVLLVARREEKLKAICDRIHQNHGRAYYYVADLTLEKDRNRLFSLISEQSLLPNILINNAGFAWYGYYSQMPWETVKSMIAVNLEAVVHLTSLFLPSMLSKKQGHIINVGSIAGKLPEQGIALYSASKAFLDSFTSSVYRELRGSHVNISVVRAGPVKTELFDSAREKRNGGSIPAEKLAIPVDTIARSIWELIKRPKKVAYVPGYLFLSPLLEVFFSRIIDFAGPILLKRSFNSRKITP
ncbi:MAG: SDR family NAD(P)-dependent oxidoreductase [Chloroflexi bacterium]|nr:SDR family NAD(P)-dependent oxidoreductase [Chloroflexota bacterium]